MKILTDYDPNFIEMTTASTIYIFSMDDEEQETEGLISVAEFTEEGYTVLDTALYVNSKVAENSFGNYI